MMGLFHKESTWDRVTKPLGRMDGRELVRSGLAAGATLLVLSAASAATSAVRRRQGGS
jgi:hypothetical protein